MEIMKDFSEGFDTKTSCDLRGIFSYCLLMAIAICYIIPVYVS